MKDGWMVVSYNNALHKWMIGWCFVAGSEKARSVLLTAENGLYPAATARTSDPLVSLMVITFTGPPVIYTLYFSMSEVVYIVTSNFINQCQETAISIIRMFKCITPYVVGCEWICLHLDRIPDAGTLFWCNYNFSELLKWSVRSYEGTGKLHNLFWIAAMCASTWNWCIFSPELLGLLYYKRIIRVFSGGSNWESMKNVWSLWTAWQWLSLDQWLVRWLTVTSGSQCFWFQSPLCPGHYSKTLVSRLIFITSVVIKINELKNVI